VKVDRHAFALMGWELLDLGDRLYRLAENRLLKQWGYWVPLALHPTYGNAIALSILLVLV